MMDWKLRYFENKEKIRHLKEILKEQRLKSRQVIVSCAFKLQEYEKQIDKVTLRLISEFLDTHFDYTIIHHVELTF